MAVQSLNFNQVSAGQAWSALRLVQPDFALIIGTCNVHAAVFQSKTSLRVALFLVPENPGREHTVEKCLHERRAEKMFTFLRLELHAKGFFQRGPDGGQCGEIAAFHAGTGIARIGGQKKGTSLGLFSGAAWSMTRLRYSAKRSPSSLAAFRGCAATGQNVFSSGASLKDSTPDGIAVVAAFEEQEAAVIRYQYLAVMFDVIADLLGVRHVVHFLVGGLDFNDAARGLRDSQERRVLVGVFELVGQ